MEPIHHYIDLSWAVVGICENARQPLLSYIPGIDEDESTAAVAYYEPANYLCWLARFILSLHVESTASVLLSFFFQYCASSFLLIGVAIHIALDVAL